MTHAPSRPSGVLHLDDLGLDSGAHLLLERALAEVGHGGELEVRGAAPDLGVHLRAWCRSQGHELTVPQSSGAQSSAAGTGSGGEGGGSGRIVGWIRPGRTAIDRWHGAQRAGSADPSAPDALAERASPSWGLAARGALVEAGAPAFGFALDTREAVWTAEAGRLYRQAAASQWDPATAVPWDAPFELPAEVEAAVVQVMTYLVENENAALVVPARFLGQVHPHFREVVQVLAVQVADEARHAEVFTRRALLRGGELGVSTVGGQASLLTLLEEPDYALAHFLLSVLGEGTFLALLSFLERNAPDPVTQSVARLALADEARHVAFGMAHIGQVVADDPSQRARLATAITRRHDTLVHTSGLNAEVLDALIVLAAGSWVPADVGRGFSMVQSLQAEMHEGRRRRLVRLGFPAEEAEALSELHTRNFM